jgi:hypothetical protein
VLGGDVVGGEVVEVLDEDVVSDVVGLVVAVESVGEVPETLVVGVAVLPTMVVDVPGAVVAVLCDELPVPVPAAYWVTTACS